MAVSAMPDVEDHAEEGGRSRNRLVQKDLTRRSHAGLVRIFEVSSPLVPASVNNSRDDQVSPTLAVVDDVVSSRKTSQTAFNLISAHSGCRRLDEQREMLRDGIDNPVCNIDTTGLLGM